MSQIRMIATAAGRLAPLSMLMFSLVLGGCGGGGGGDGSSPTVVDNVPPTVASTTPANSAVDVPVAATVTVTFSEPMLESGVNGAMLVLTRIGDGAPVAGTVTCSGAIATFRPDRALDYASSYRVTVKAGVEDLAGNAMLSDRTITFTTGADVTSPVVVSTDPAGGATGIAVTKVLSAAFSKVIDCATVDATTFLVNGLTGVVGCSDTLVTFTPSTSLDYASTYTATLKGTIADLAGNSLGSDHLWSFTTTAGSGAPYVTEVYPDNGQKGVCLNSEFLVKFSENIDHATLIPGSSFLFASTDGVVPGSIASIDSPTWTWFNPDTDLPRNTDYTLTITRDVTDWAGNPMESDFIAHYTTTWTTLLGTLQNELGTGIDTGPEDSVYLVGTTRGNLVPGYGNSYSDDLFIAKYAVSGELQWVDQRGGVSNLFNEAALDVAVDVAGNAFLVGYGSSDMDGQVFSGGGNDILLMKYAPDGSHLWTVLNGTDAGDIAYGVAVDEAGIYAAGVSGGSLDGLVNAGGSDAFVARYDQQGNLQWSRLLGTTDEDTAKAIALDATGNLFITGSTRGGIDGHVNQQDGLLDYFLAKYDAQGTLLWTAQDGTPAQDWGTGVAVTSLGDPVVVGGTYGNYADGAVNDGTGSTDYFVAMYDGSTGALKWKQQLGELNYSSEARDVVVDGKDNVYVVGTSPRLDGSVGSGGNEYFVVKYDGNGVKQWSRLSWALHGGAQSAAFDSTGRIYLGGTSTIYPDPGNLCGVPPVGAMDAFIVPYDVDGNRL